jgi:4-hydroxy-tetrahydrodipicolinate synthase
MSVETMARLAKLPHIIGVKDATADVARVTKQRLAIGDKFCQLSGEDPTQVGFLAQGGDGCISVTANVAPKPMAEMHAAWREGDVKLVQKINDRLMPLHENLFVETNPAPVKYAASLLGKCTPECRLPMVELREASKEKVQTAMRSAGILN